MTKEDEYFLEQYVILMVTIGKRTVSYSPPLIVYFDCLFFCIIKHNYWLIIIISYLNYVHYQVGVFLGSDVIIVEMPRVIQGDECNMCAKSLSIHN